MASSSAMFNKPILIETSVEALLAKATAREPISNGDGKSGALLERVTIDGERYVVKHLNVAQDWTMRAVGELTSAVVTVWRLGLFERLPACINQPIVGLAVVPVRTATTQLAATETTLLMRDVSRWLVPESDDLITVADNLRFVDHMASIHACFWAGGRA